MRISGSIALVTGANRGIGRHFTEELLKRGAAKVYATARDPELIDTPGVERLRLDITDQEAIETVAAAAPDTTLLINNAGVNTWTNLVDGDLAKIRLELATHFYGPLGMARAFAPVLAGNGGGAILNVLSAMSWFSYDGANAYGVGKAAGWSLTNGIRIELAGQGTLVTGLHLGAADTDMSAGYDGDKMDPAEIVRLALDGIEAGKLEVVADEWSAHVKASLAADPSAFYYLAPAAG
ncbi:SDR family oxidoreductase [Micromonospora sp. NPDC050417]|uniref:SDR family oxidoreductase n=1 Tax=Micromonospora sp. NPDC050417 TaxID=3364280 RepID=UPI0037924D42